MVRTRFAPSPTGELHIGSLRNALYPYLWAKKNQGEFVLRIEDTDQERSVPGAVERIIKTLKIFNLKYDEGPDIGGNYGPYIQSQRLKIYQQQVRNLVSKGHAYYCFCTEEELKKQKEEQRKMKKPPKYNGSCRQLTKLEIKKQLATGKPYVIRLKVPKNKTVIFRDLLRGEIKTNSDAIDDQILLKSDAYPTYHLAVVVDDYLMKITHIIRGQEWLPSTPKHILLYQAFGWPIPIFIHTNNIIDEKKRKLSKRHGDVSVEYFLNQGYLPEVILNFIALLGWNPGGKEEQFNLTEMIKIFELEDLNKAAAYFDQQKLDWLNNQYINQLTDERLTIQIKPYLSKDLLINKTLLNLLRQRLNKFSEIKKELFFLNDQIYQPELLIYKTTDKKTSLKILEQIKKLLISYQGDLNQNQLKQYFQNYIQKNNLKLGEVLWPFRIALAGQRDSPDVFEMAEILGKEKTLMKIEVALKLLTK